MAKNYLTRYAKEHPYLLALNIGLSVAGFAVPPLLGALGFTGAGVGAGMCAQDLILRYNFCFILFYFKKQSHLLTSMGSAGTAAAAWQSTFMGAVPKGGLFAVCQSIAATGSAPFISAAGWATGGVITGATVILDNVKGGRGPKKNKSESEEEMK